MVGGVHPSQDPGKVIDTVAVQGFMTKTVNEMRDKLSLLTGCFHPEIQRDLLIADGEGG